jgi:hypothetical protein
MALTSIPTVSPSGVTPSMPYPIFVFGSGKSTLVNELLHPLLQQHLTKRIPFPKDVDELQGISAIDKVIIIDRSPIGRTPRSNPVTYTGVLVWVEGREERRENASIFPHPIPDRKFPW